jgi:outer membrane protein assembly factor BamB
MVNDGGIVTCYDALSGDTVFQERLPPATFSASPVVAQGKIYITSEAGETFVLAAAPQLEILSRNPLAERCLASPACARGRILLRTEQHLWCIGND